MRIVLASILFVISCTDGEHSNQVKLDLRGKRMNRIPQAILANHRIEELHIGTDGYVAHPPLSLVPNLEIKLSRLPEEVSNLSKLRRLTISSTQIQHLPQSMANLTNLRYLNLSFNENLDPTRELEKLVALPMLDTLVIIDRDIEVDLAAKLKQSRPELVIVDRQVLFEKTTNEEMNN